MYQSYKVKYFWGKIIVSTNGSDSDRFLVDKLK